MVLGCEARLVYKLVQKYHSCVDSLLCIYVCGTLHCMTSECYCVAHYMPLCKSRGILIWDLMRCTVTSHIALSGTCLFAMQMLLEIQQMHDNVLEHKVNVAISSNRLTRLDNPIVHDKLKSLKRQAETIFRAAADSMEE